MISMTLIMLMKVWELFFGRVEEVADVNVEGKGKFTKVVERRLAIVVAYTGDGVRCYTDHFGEYFVRDVFFYKDDFETIDFNLIWHRESL